MTRNCTIYYDHGDMQGSISKDFESDIPAVVTELIERLKKIESQCSSKIVVKSIMFHEVKEI